MRKIFLPILFLFNLLHAETFLSSKEFNLWARPQAKSIVKDFFNIVKLLNSEQFNFRIFEDYIENTNNRLKEIRIECPKRLNAICLDKLKLLKISLFHIEKEVFQYESSQKLGFLFFYDLYFLQQLNLLHNEIFELISLLDKTIDQIDYKENTKISFLEIDGRFDKIETIIELSLANHFAFTNGREYFKVWSQFIMPLNKYVVRNHNQSYLENNLDSLNSNWNQFHFWRSKSPKAAPNNIKPLINTIHNRWVNILKISLTK